MRLLKCSGNRFIVCTFTTLVFLFSVNREVNSTTKIISVSDFNFTPSNVNVIVGDTVKWTLTGTRSHTTTCDGLFPGTSLPSGASPWNSPLDDGNPIYTYVVTVAGSYDYVCRFNYLSNNMRGTIIAEFALPVELTDFVATTIKNEVILDWSTGGEINNDRFEVQRIDISESDNIDFNDLPFKTIGLLQGQGTSNEINNYRYIDRNLRTGIYLYRLKQVDYNSNFIYHLLRDEIVIGVPAKFNLSQNYPNPFNPVTHINFEIPENGFVTISLFDITGRIVSTILSSNISAGYQTAVVNGADLSSGVYYYKIDFRSESRFETAIKRMMLIK